MLYPIRLTMILLMFAPLCARADDALTAVPAGAAASVFRILATDARGHAKNGSAVLLAPGKLVTACHVLRGAKSIAALRDGMAWPVSLAAGNFNRDLCILSAPKTLGGNTAEPGLPANLKLGDTVIAVGYPRGDILAVTRGEIKGLHMHDGAEILQVSSPFDHGQSGGALFDADGKLIGVIAFKAIAGGNFHFALPLAWLRDVANTTMHGHLANKPGSAFWERPRARQPLFLQAASLEADRNWKALSGTAEEWVMADTNNPASWLCLARALSRLERGQEAMHALSQARALEPVLRTTELALLP